MFIPKVYLSFGSPGVNIYRTSQTEVSVERSAVGKIGCIEPTRRNCSVYELLPVAAVADKVTYCDHMLAI